MRAFSFSMKRGVFNSLMYLLIRHQRCSCSGYTLFWENGLNQKFSVKYREINYKHMCNTNNFDRYWRIRICHVRRVLSMNLASSCMSSMYEVSTPWNKNLSNIRCESTVGKWVHAYFSSMQQEVSRSSIYSQIPLLYWSFLFYLVTKKIHKVWYDCTWQWYK